MHLHSHASLLDHSTLLLLLLLLLLLYKLHQQNTRTHTHRYIYIYTHRTNYQNKKAKIWILEAINF